MILSIDHGTKYIGLAIADEKIRIAHPRGFLLNKNYEYVLAEIKNIITEQKISLIVVGQPLGLSGQATEQTKLANKFIEQLRNDLNLPVDIFNETMTTKMAGQVGGKKENSSGHDAAAAIILQDYLDRLGNKN
ncbi:MAG: Holliday junction resolvase RuvX [Patescibacteria group bacterium]|nr:Holliday junction resolvase RuvX [Patescibacteria group bacterium]MDD5121655.1 Holliday junction resolvase RuvX [Patescibacteria group bacterium]MDD5222127.1 Holliday junction resolvase RuvX [Patescibacteria group bacterium]MDD5396181.1 Holliday junction resolvase RuvX [Patescibacteria group bacterium]